MSSSYVYSSNSLSCLQKYNCNHSLPPSSIKSATTSSDTSSSTSSPTASSQTTSSSTTTSPLRSLSATSVFTTSSLTKTSSAPSSSAESSTTTSSSATSLSSTSSPATSSAETTSSLTTPSLATAGRTSPPSNATPPPPSSDSGSLSTGAMMGLSIGLTILVLALMATVAFMIWRYRVLNQTKVEPIKPRDVFSETSEGRLSTPPIVEADGYPAGYELETPLPVRELDGRLRPAEIHGIPLAELEEGSRRTLGLTHKVHEHMNSWNSESGKFQGG
ncbi:hypothetical protein F4677DRAFT_429899 [Hypoxylon crocopeplum]|nr:hypothetical protein F4677DRAFT_429899 [Hypoxylon crocopeplum]